MQDDVNILQVYIETRALIKMKDSYQKVALICTVRLIVQRLLPILMHNEFFKWLTNK